MKYKILKACTFLTMIAAIFIACKGVSQYGNVLDGKTAQEQLLFVRFNRILKYPVNADRFPRSYDFDKQKTREVPARNWTSGFFPGNLWNIFLLTGDSLYLNRAKEWTALMEPEKNNGKTHDMGFKMMCSYGLGYTITKSENYKQILLESANTLSTRFNEKVGCLRSWDFNADIWEFPVIIDNMMNLELLFEATRLSGDSTYHKIAVSHANTTLKNHIRKDNSSYHVVVYDTISGSAKNKITYQGYADNSSWVRGQTWGVYGYAMSYRYTKDERYLKQAIATADFFLDHPNLPEDKVPYWDFDDPNIPNAPKDVSAAAILASALFELYTLTESENYKETALNILKVLQSDVYMLSKDEDTPFLLNYSTGNMPQDDEVEVPIVYADYYFLEAILRQNKLLKK